MLTLILGLSPTICTNGIRSTTKLFEMIVLSDKEARKLTALDREMRVYRSEKLVMGYTVNRVTPIATIPTRRQVGLTRVRHRRRG